MKALGPLVVKRRATVTGTRLWCDAARAQGVTFVSGADVVLRGANRGAWCTTERNARRRLAGPGLGDVVLPALFGRPFAIGRARLELLPAGRLPGSAQLRVWASDGQDAASTPAR